MAKAKKAQPADESIIEAVDSGTKVEATENILEAPVQEVAIPLTAEIKALLDQINACVDKLGRIGHLYYAKKVGQEISQLVAQIRARI